MSELAIKAADEKYCGDCGAVIKIKAELCPKCGVRQNNPLVIVKNRKSKTSAALFAFFLGGFGGHKFYLGQTGLGFAYLIFCWTFIPGIIAFIEFILFLIMSDEKFDYKYN